MASFDKALADFVTKFGEEAVPSALNLFVSQRERGKAYAEKRKQDTAKAKAILSLADDPAIAEILRKRGIKV